MNFKEEAVQFLHEHSKRCTQLELVEKAMEHGAAIATAKANVMLNDLVNKLRLQRPDQDSKTEARWLGINP